LSTTFDLGIGLQDVLLALAVLVATWIAVLLVRRAFSRYVSRRGDRLDAGTVTKFRMIQRLAMAALGFVGIGLALWMLNAEIARKAAVAMFASAGIIGIALGFAAQTTAANLVSGIMIAFTQPLRLGDRVEVMTDRGAVEDIGLFFTTLRTWDNVRVVIPNKVLSEEVIRNFTVLDPRHPAVIDLRLPYGVDLDTAQKLLVEEAAANELCISDPPPSVYVSMADELGVSLRLIAYAEDYSRAFELGVALREKAVERLQEAGIAVGVDLLPLFPRGGESGGKGPSEPR
jgi:small conductance mechanosensitive channel